MIKALSNRGIPQPYVLFIQKKCMQIQGQGFSLIKRVLTAYFHTKKGVKQGDPLTPVLFNCALQEIFRNLNWENKGIKVDGEMLSNPRFADDAIFVAENIDDMKIILDDLIEKGKEADLVINIDNKQNLSRKKRPHILYLKIIGKLIENVRECRYTWAYMYLGQTISLENNRYRKKNRKKDNIDMEQIYLLVFKIDLQGTFQRLPQK